MLNQLCAGAGVLSLVSVAGGAGLAHYEVISPMAGLVSLAMGGLLGLVGLVLAGAVLVSTQSLPSTLLGLLGLVPLSLMTVFIVNAMRYPRINDITTDLADPPAFTHAPTLPANTGRDMSFPESNAALVEANYPAVKTVVIDAAPEAAYAAALGLAEDFPDWEVTARDPAETTFEGVATTTVYRFRDDFVVRIRPAENGASAIDMRSKSRVGRSDLGANAQRIKGFIEAVRRKLRGQD